MAKRRRLSTSKSFAQAAKRVKAFQREMKGKAGSATRQIAEEIKTDVAASRPGKGVPRDEGVLAGSLRAIGPSEAGESRVSAGGAAAPYALVQHENLEFQHDLGEARYLVRGLERWKPHQSEALKELQKESIAAIRRARRGGV